MIIWETHNWSNAENKWLQDARLNWSMYNITPKAWGNTVEEGKERLYEPDDLSLWLDGVF